MDAVRGKASRILACVSPLVSLIDSSLLAGACYFFTKDVDLHSLIVLLKTVLRHWGSGWLIFSWKFVTKKSQSEVIKLVCEAMYALVTSFHEAAENILTL